METKIIGYDRVDEVVEALRRGEVIAFPTETVFGLGAISTSKEAFDRLVKVKNRHPDKPFTLMCSSLGMAAAYADVDARSANVLKALLPGQLTALLKAKEGLSEWMTLGSDTIGIRVPDDNLLRDLIERVGVPLLVPSANKADEPPQLTKEGVFDVFNGEIALILEGNCKSNTPSTIVNFRSNNPVLIRKGVVDIDEINKYFNKPVEKVALGADHGGFDAKEAIKTHLQERGYEVIDCGTYSTKSCDYPDFAFKVGEEIKAGCDFGVVVCTSGEGISIAANRNRHVRCGIGYDDVVVAKMREHNDANVISFGAKYMALRDILRRVDIFMLEKFSVEEKHHRRVKKLGF